MIRYKLLRLCGSAAMASLVFLFSSVCLVIGIGAQSAESAIAGSSTKSAAPSAFLVAPSIPLGYAPSSVSTGDLRRSGRLDLVTADYDSGKITVFLGAGQGKFVPGVEYDAGSHPSSVLVADISGDGRPDVLVSNESEGTISVLLGSGDGTLQPRQSYSVGFNPTFIATGDFSGTGSVDVAVAGNSGNLLAIFVNDGNGNLQKPVLRSLSKTPTALTVADFDNDGHADIALANTDGTVSILLGKGAGQFRSLADIVVSSGALKSISSGDFNKDGKIDLVVTQPGKKLVSVLFGKGNGAFGAPASYAVGHEPVSTLIADVNEDGVPDLVVINNQSNTFGVLEGIGDGTFRSSLDFVAGNAPLAAVAGDFYGSGHVDLAIINHSSQTVSVPSGYGDGTFKTARSYFSGQQPVSIASGVLKAGTKPGLVVANYCGSDLTCSSTGNVAVFLRDSSGAYHLSSTYAVGAGPVSVALADVNGDKSLDIVAVNRLDKTVSVLMGVGDGTFRQPTTIPLAAAPVAVAVGDLNKDGKPDLAVLEDCGAATCKQAGSLEILLGAGDGNFQSAVSHVVGYSPSSLAIGDINGDKNLDVVVANRCGKDPSCLSAGTASVLIGDGKGKFTAGASVNLGNSPSAIALGNLTGSGLDLVVARSADNTVAVLRGNGDGTFKPAVPYVVGNKPGSLVVADFNGDGNADVAVANLSDSTASVLFGKGDGTMQPATALAVGNSPTALTVIGSATAGHASLATADGAGPSGVGTEFKVLPQINPGTDFASFTLALTAGTNPSNVNDSVTFTASITGDGTDVPAQNVEFTFGGTPISDCGGATGEPVTSSGVNTYTSVCKTSTLTAGTGVSVTAMYLPGDAVYQDNQVDSSNVTQTVTPLATTLGLSSPGASSVNAPVTFTAQLSSSSLTPVLPSGSVDFEAGGTTITGCGAVAVNASGAAQCTTSTLTAPSAAISAAYSGDPSYTVAAPGTMTQTVNAAAATIAVSSPGASNVNAAVTLTAQLGGVALTPTTPLGKVAFTANGTTITGCGAVAVNASGAAQCTTSALVAPSDAISVTYSSDANFTVATAGTMTQTVNAIAATIAVSSPGASNANAAVTLTAQLGGVALTPTLPSGKVAFTANGTTITGCGAVAVNATGAAQCTTSALVAPSDAISVTYSGDTSYTVATAGTMTQTVNPLTPTFGLSAAPSGPVVVDTPVTFTAALSGVLLTPVSPAGTVTFVANGVTIPGCTALSVNGSAGKATCTTSSLVVPADAIVATYSPDPNFTVAAPAMFTETVTQATASTTLASSPTSPSVNQAVTLSATVLAPGGAGGQVQPTGSVTFTQGATTLCTAAGINTTTHIATCNYAFNSAVGAPGSTITATYSGDQNFLAGVPGTSLEVVTASTTTTSVASSPNPSAVNQQVAFTATVTPAFSVGTTPAKPTGTVVFSNTSTSPATILCTQTLSNGVVPVCNFTFTSSGSNNVVATYTSADSNFTGSASAPTGDVQGVGTSATSIALTSSPTTSFVDESVTFTATINTNSGATAPSGTMTFTDGATTLCTATLTAAGIVPACPYAFLSPGSHSIVASYSGDANFKPGASNPVAQGVSAAATTTSLVSSPNPSAVNQAVNFTATVTRAFTAGTALPTGTVVFSNTSTSPATTLCTKTLSNGIVPVCTYTFASSGSNSVVATYTSGDLNFTGSASPANGDVQAVGLTTTTTTLLAAPSPSAVNQQVAFTATIASGVSGSTSPTGTVAFSYTIGGGPSVNLQCTLAQPISVSTTSGVTTALCLAPLPAIGTYSVTAAYSGDKNFALSSGQVSQIVKVQPLTVAVSSSQSPSTVNQPVNFTATLTLANSGAAQPTSTVTFVDTLTNFPLCSSAPLTGVSAAIYTATCALPATASWTAATHPITATYNGDPNFAATTSPVFPQVVMAGPTSATLTSDLPISVATQAVTFTATVIPALTGAIVPSGFFTFTSTGTWNPAASCQAAPVAPITSGTGAGTAIARCTASFPATASTQTISAAYTGDPNFIGSSISIGQTVQNFSIANAVIASSSSITTTGPITLTQGYSTATNSVAGTDPFNPTTVKVVVTSTGAFSDQLNVNCVVTNSTHAVVTDPSCTMSTTTTPPSSTTLSGVNGTTSIYTLSASSAAPIGAYTVTLTAADGSTSALSNVAAPLTVNVIGVANPLSLARGASGQENVSFNTFSAPQADTFTAIACGTVVPLVNGTAGSPLSSPGVTCTSQIPSGGAPVISGGVTTVAVSISTAGATAAQLQRSNTISLAAFLGVPLLALMGWVGSRKSPRKNFFRFLGLILLLVGASFATGCGGSFTSKSTSSSTGIPAGNYLVQVVATDQNGNSYYGAIPLDVSSN
jgi:large repetitive protein